MSADVVVGWPPNIEAIKAVLPVTSRNIFAHGHTIYNPGGGELGPELIAHEEVHFAQQAVIGTDKWWQKFLEDVDFRLAQEIPAHKVEYRTFCRHNRDRNAQARFLRQLGTRLAAPMYGGVISVRDAMKRIR